jgi:hypothetical protein
MAILFSIAIVSQNEELKKIIASLVADDSSLSREFKNKLVSKFGRIVDISSRRSSVSGLKNRFGPDKTIYSNTAPGKHQQETLQTQVNLRDSAPTNRALSSIKGSVGKGTQAMAKDIKRKSLDETTDAVWGGNSHQ